MSKIVIHELLKPLSWLIGKWRADTTKGFYPTLKDFFFTEEAEFTHCGKAYMQYSLYSFDYLSKEPMHRDIGFLKVDADGTKASLVSAQHFGFVEVEEGTVSDLKLRLESHSVGQISFSGVPNVKKIVRSFQRDGDTLVQVVEMETEKTPLTEHLRTTYQLVAEESD